MFLNRETGEMVFSDGFRLFAGKSADELSADADIYFAGAHSAQGVPLSVVCHFKRKALCAVTLCPLNGSAARRRASLFAALQIADICPDTRGCIRIAAPFGELNVAGEPYFGHTSARIEYTERA